MGQVLNLLCTEFFIFLHVDLALDDRIFLFLQSVDVKYSITLALEVVAALEVFVTCFVLVSEKLIYLCLACINLESDLVAFGLGLVLSLFDCLHLLSELLNLCISLSCNLLYLF